MLGTVQIVADIPLLLFRQLNRCGLVMTFAPPPRIGERVVIVDEMQVSCLFFHFGLTEGEILNFFGETRYFFVHAGSFLDHTQ